MPEPEPTSENRIDRRARRDALRHARASRRRRTILFACAALAAVAVAVLVGLGVRAAVGASGPRAESHAVPGASANATSTMQPAVQTAASPATGAAQVALGVRTPQPGEPSPPVCGSAAIHVPAEGSPEYDELIKAARLHLGTSAKLGVRQLYSDGAWAVGEIERRGGRRTFIAWRREVPDGWMAYWSEGADDASQDALLDADRRVACGVPARIIWP